MKRPDKLFLDANVLFSIAYGSSGLAVFREMARSGRCRLMASRFVIEEARRNLRESTQIEELERLTVDLEVVSEADPTVPCPLELPQKDRPVFMAAIAVGADYFLTGDRLHFGQYFGTRIGSLVICAPRQYLSKKDG